MHSDNAIGSQNCFIWFIFLGKSYGVFKQSAYMVVEWKKYNVWQSSNKKNHKLMKITVFTAER